jgi:hypothetical protein
VEYFDFKRQWTRRVLPHLQHPDVQSTLIVDFNKFTFGRWEKPFLAGMVPFDFESCDWFIWHKGKMPRYWQYVKHSACHWLVNFNLELAQRVAPASKWRVVTSPLHSTVWDGDETLFDINYSALGVSPIECMTSAGISNKCGFIYPEARCFNMLPCGQHAEVGFANHYSKGI